MLIVKISLFYVIAFMRKQAMQTANNNQTNKV